MKLFNKISSFALAASLAFASCEKADDLKTFADGTAPVLSTPTATVAPNASDSNKVSLVLNWTDPKYASAGTTKYILEIDSTNRNFSRAYTKTLSGKLTDSIIAKELNTVMLAWGFEFNKAYDLDVRVTSSYANNNERKTSNILKIRATPYKIPPKVALPVTQRLFIIGGATDGGWNNPVPVPSQEFARIDETTWGGVFQLSSSQGYLLLPENGSWGTKYVTTTPTNQGGDLQGSFQFSTGPGSDFTSPATSGLYKFTVDFQQGRYKLEPISIVNGLPNNLFIVGGATPGGWNNPVPVPQQQLARRNSAQWDITLNFTSGQAYLLLPVNGSWGQKYGAENATAPNAGLGGKIKGEGADIPAPPANGSYKFTVDFYKGEYKLTQ
jgi:hypothetical protein